MATGIVSVALADHGASTVSGALMWADVALWLALAAVVAAAFARSRRAFCHELQTPAALAIPAASAVLGSRLVLADADWAAAALLAVGFAAWLPLTIAVARRRRTRVAGSAFLLTVAPEGLAVLCAALSAADGAGWLLVPALALGLIGAVLYVVVVARFAPGELIRGAGDQWVVGGALAIVTLALATIASAAGADAWPRSVVHGFATAAFVVWIAAMAWLPVLVAAEVLRPRLGFDSRRWATVFPLGMYAAMSFAVDRSRPRAAVATFASAWTWVALAAWCVVAAAAVGQLRDRRRRPDRPVAAL